MHITDVRIAGFKSFVDPQDLPIEPGLTGIVGPNGCGKSNLLEALRWAMGANSARAMRGGEMDDLIFSGSADRPARETAEVTLVLDNASRSAPAEFNHDDVLEIVRKLKRGAGSTYKLNGRTVRGKDVQLLFADASTGANSPSLVRQGQISELIGAKPQNRRRILEEAAGIGGLNSRRHEAELKLRGAEANLERMTEVSAEIERQLESLKRQARKARKYRALSEEIAALDALVAHLRWVEAKAALEACEAGLEDAKRQVESLTRADAMAEKARIEAGEGLAPLRQKESETAGKLGQARIALARLETERQSAADLEARLMAEAQRLSEDIERESANLDEARQSAAEASESLAELAADNPEERAKIEQAAESRFAEAQAGIARLQAAHDESQSALADARAAHNAARADLEAKTRREAELAREIERHEAELGALESAEALNKSLAASRKAETAAEMALQDAELAVDAAEDALAEARKEEDSAQPARDDARAALSALEAEIAGLERLLRRSEAAAAPPVIERVKTRPGYEKAVAAALGDDLQASTDKGAPLFWAGAGAARQALPEGAEPLSKYVDAPGELAPRLAQCGIVSSEDGAALASHLKPGQRLVSTEGHLWRWDGFTRTPKAPVSAAERLEQQARLETAQKDLAKARAAAEDAAEAHESAVSERREAEAALKEARAATPALSRALNERHAEAVRAEQAAERAALKRETLSEALKRAQTEHGSISSALAQANGAAAEADLETLESTLETAREALSEARSEENEARGALSDLKRTHAEANERRARLEREAETWTARANGVAERLTKLKERHTKADTDAQAARSRPATLAAEVDARAAEVEALEQARRDAADALAAKEAAIREADSAAREAAADAARAREALAGGKVKLENAQGRFAETVEAAQTQFGRTPEALLTLARAGIEDEEIEALSLSEASSRADDRKRDRDALGGVNMDAEEEAEELESRMGSHAEEKADLTAAIAKLREGVDALNAEGRDRLLAAFETVNEHFKALFTTLFRGGQAELRLVDADDPLAAGLEIMAQPPGKRLGTLNLMSGGEQALTATALIFAVFLSRPAPICVLDEVDAPLDDANVDRFCRMLDEMRKRTETRFVMITHNAVTMSRMDRLFGVTMREKGVSRLVSVDLGTAEELVAA